MSDNYASVICKKNRLDLLIIMLGRGAQGSIVG
jgi:hypothetical protein